jgi:hypothetical protein
MEEQSEAATRDDLAEAGGAIGGGLIGLGATALAGPVVGSVVGGAAQAALRRITDLVLRRAWGRESERIEFAVQVFVEEVQRRSENGERIRDDGFFKDGDVHRSDSEELWEATLRHVMTEYQERKISARATMFASVLFRPDIDSDYAHYLVRLADRLSYRQLTIMAALRTEEHGEAEASIERRRIEWENLPDDQKSESWTKRDRPIAADLAGEMDELGDLDLIGFRSPDGSMTATDEVWGSGSSKAVDWGAFALSDVGGTMHDLMRLGQTIAPEDVAAAAAAMAGR